MSYKCRVDKNQPEIVKELRSYGCSILHVHTIKNAFDILVGYNGVNYCFEIKRSYKQGLTDGEAKFQREWKGQVHTIYNSKDAIKIIEDNEFKRTK